MVVLKANAETAGAKEKVTRESISSIYFQRIDILRGLASLGVVLFHARVNLWVGWKVIQAHPEQYSGFDRAAALLSIPLPFLGSTVMLFFLLSGFCIHFPTESSKEIKVKLYAIRRFFRIYPPYVVAVIFSLIIEWICQKEFGQGMSRSFVIVKTFIMAQNYPREPQQIASNPSLWSLPVEFELYIFYPVAFWLSLKIGRLTTLIMIGVVSLCALCLTLTSAPWLEGNFAEYWIIWCSGCLLAHLFSRKKKPVWNNWFLLPMFAAFVTAILMTIFNKPYVINHFIWAIGYFFLIFWVFSRSTETSIIPRPALKILVWLGQISYSLYLIHFPIFKLLGSLWEHYHGDKPANLLITFAATLITLPAAAFFYRNIEKPFHDIARKIGSRNKTLVSDKRGSL